MKHTAKKYRKYLVLLISVLVGLSVWRVSEAFNSSGQQVIYSIEDNEVPVQARLFFEQLGMELRHAGRILLAEPHQMILTDASGTIHYYEYAYQTLWRDGDPMVFDVTAFYFEFRNGMKQNMHRFSGSHSPIQTVGYAAHVSHHTQRMVIQGREKLHPSCNTEINQRGIHYSMR